MADAAMAISAAGYATDPSYAQKIYNVANKASTLVASNQNVGSTMNSMVATHDAFRQMKEDTSEKPAPTVIQSMAGDHPDVPVITHPETPLPVRLSESTGINI